MLLRSSRVLPLLALAAAAPLAAQARPKTPPASPANTIPVRAPLVPRDDPRVRVVSIPGTVPRPREAAILLPRDYGTSSRRYPVLYLLHGLGGAWDNWLSRTNVLEYTQDLPLIVVMPDGADSWYARSVSDTTRNFQHYIAEDVVNYVDSNFRTLPYGQARFLAGLSMGGYGAISLAMRYPNRYALSASFSGAVALPKNTDSPSIDSVFGPPTAPTRDSLDLPALLRRADPRGLPYFYLDCGTGDRLLQANRTLTAILAERGIPYEYHEVRGVHEWEYWDRRLPVVLQLVRERIRPFLR